MDTNRPRHFILKRKEIQKSEFIHSAIKQTSFFSPNYEDNFRKNGTLIVNYCLSLENNICLRNHFVEGRACFPLDAYLELIYVASQTHFKFDFFSFEQLIISAPIVMDNNDKFINIILYFTNEQDSLKFKLVSIQKNNHIEKIHITGELMNFFAPEFYAKISILSSQSPVREFDVKAFYTKSTPIQLNNFYHNLNCLDFFEDYAIAKIFICQSEFQFLLDPRVISAALSCAINFSYFKVSQSYLIGEDYFLPYKASQLRPFRILNEGYYYCLVKIINYKKSWTECLLQLIDENDKVVFIIEKLRLQRITSKTQFVKNNQSQPTSLDTQTPHHAINSKQIEQDVAIIGMSCRLPKVKNIDDFWDVLINGQDCIEEIQDIRWREFENWYHPDPKNEGTASSKYVGLLEDYNCFDSLFFNISPSEAELMDPQQRIFLEEAWSAIENAGYGPSSLAQVKCGVYVGCTTGDYSQVLVQTAHHWRDQCFTGNSSAILAARISYFLNLKGPALSLDTACSSSLTAVHLAAESIRQGENELALAGGVSVFSSPLSQILTCQLGMQSTRGRCRPFDQHADGTVFSEGCGVILLKSLRAAIEDEDIILGVIKGSGINQDGKTNGITAPSARSQTKLLTDIYKKYKINPNQISYIETHGTATTLGDPIEIEGLKDAFHHCTTEEKFCAIGSVKSNIGHTNYAAGIAGLIKVLLCMKNKRLVPSIHYEVPNQHINFEDSPFFVNQKNNYWQPSHDTNRIAGVSAFGFSGTNAHVIIEEYSQISEKMKYTTGIPAGFETDLFLVPISAKSDAALNRIIANLRNFLTKNIELNNSINISDIAYTLQVGRDTMDYRAVFIVKNVVELIEKFDLFLTDEVAVFSGKGIYKRKIESEKENHYFEKNTHDQLKQWFNSEDISQIAKYWLGGHKIDWKSLYHELPKRIMLPSYAFEKISHWPAQSNTTEQNIAFVQLPTKLDFKSQLEYDLKVLVGQLLKLETDQIDTNLNFFKYGFDSITLAKYAQLVSKNYNISYGAENFFIYTCISQVANNLFQEYNDKVYSFYHENPQLPNIPKALAKNSVSNSVKMVNKEILKNEDPIAIIGMSGKFPMSGDLDQYWKNLVKGKDCISEIPIDRWDWKKYYSDESNHNKNKTNIIWGGFIDRLQYFDPKFFNISEEEATLMDPQHRLLLCYTYKAIENAGYNPKTLSNNKTGVFIAIGNNGYNKIIENAKMILDGYFATGTLPSIAANRISHFFDFHGPSEIVESACASSLIAVHRAISEINNANCDLAVVGGINTIITPQGHLALSRQNLLSSDGRCKPFSSQANGYVRSEGVGIILLKRLSLAKAHGDHIYGIIRGIEVNHNGAANFLTAPNPIAQSVLIEKLYRQTKINIETVNYIETHGTGTKLGDAIEMEGLKIAYANLTNQDEMLQQASATNLLPHDFKCGLGSVKSNIGHSEIASGMASIFKVLYQLKHKMLIKTLHDDDNDKEAHHQNKNDPFYVVRENQTWQPIIDKDNRPLPLRAGISTFGFGGVNAHLILEEFIDSTEKSLEQISDHLLVFSSDTQDKLKSLIQRMYHFIFENSQISLNNLAYTLQMGREHMKIRLAIVANNLQDLLKGLESYLSKNENINSFVLELIQNDDLKQLALFWASGGEVDWSLLHVNTQNVRVPLPGYEFSETHYWPQKAIHDNLFLDKKTKKLNEGEDIYFNNEIQKNNLFSKWYGQSQDIILE